jgi:hypothetical protein
MGGTYSRLLLLLLLVHTLADILRCAHDLQLLLEEHRHQQALLAGCHNLAGPSCCSWYSLVCRGKHEGVCGHSCAALSCSCSLEHHSRLLLLQLLLFLVLLYLL